MATTFSTILSPNPYLKNLSLASQTPLFTHVARLRSSLSIAKPIKAECTHKFSGNFVKNLGFSRNRNITFVLKAQNENKNENSEDEEEEELRGKSSMPDRFRPLTKEAPDKPVRWPWFIALAFMLYAWRTVLWELSNWKKAVAAIFRFLGYISKLVLALIFHFIGDPITSLIRGIETTIYAIRASYSWVIGYAPLQELTIIIMLASIVLAIAEATVPDSVNSQPYLLTVAGVIGFAAVRGYISELFFWTLLVGMFGFARLVKKRDYVSSALPVAVVLAAVGEPWIRIIAMASYLALAIFQHSKKPLEGKEDRATGIVKRIPVPLLCAALAIGVRLAAKWAGYRHLTWMIV